jgi:GDP-L-fucose synthase
MVSHINVGYWPDVTIADLAHSVARATGFTGQIRFDASKPDGTPRKLMDSSRLQSLGWHAKVDLPSGLELTYRDFLEHSPPTPLSAFRPSTTQ